MIVHALRVNDRYTTKRPQLAGVLLSTRRLRLYSGTGKVSDSFTSSITM